MALVSVLLLNVHGWAPPSPPRDLSDQIVPPVEQSMQASLARLAINLHPVPDLIALNEARFEPEVFNPFEAIIYDLEESTGKEWEAFAGSGLGNALLSSLPLRPDTGPDFLDIGPSSPPALHICCQTSPISIDFDIVCVHLDVLKEETRLEQLRSLLGLSSLHPAHLILGDFNALTQGDYSLGFSQIMIEERRQRARREPVAFEVTKVLRARGYCDVFEFLNKRSSEPLLDSGLATSRYSTRVDYVFASPDFTNLIDWDASIASILRQPEAQFSDHSAQHLVLALRQKPA